MNKTKNKAAAFKKLTLVTPGSPEGLEEKSLGLLQNLAKLFDMWPLYPDAEVAAQKINNGVEMLRQEIDNLRKIVALKEGKVDMQVDALMRENDRLWYLMRLDHKDPRIALSPNDPQNYPELVSRRYDSGPVSLPF